MRYVGLFIYRCFFIVSFVFIPVLFLSRIRNVSHSAVSGDETDVRMLVDKQICVSLT
jgi:hypothetical protein